MASSNSDEKWMARALELAALGRGKTSPNPLVGAVVVANQCLIGEGYHPAVGQAHAEVFALNAAAGNTKGSTVYVTLEPCSFHGRTPPCAQALIQAGVTRVVVAMEDPDSRVSGKGIHYLRQAGVDVNVGVLEPEARQLNAAYIHHRTSGKPLVLLKIAQTLDGQIATQSGQSQWITGQEARSRVHLMRSESDAVLVGVGTVLADDPLLSVRHIAGPQPRRVVLDTTGRTPSHARILVPIDDTTTLVYVTERADLRERRRIEASGALCLPMPRSGDGKIDIGHVLLDLGERDIMDLMIEGGQGIATSFLKARAAQRMACFVAPRLLGTGIPAIGDLGITHMNGTVCVSDVLIEQLGDDLLISGTLEYNN
jgi:diaminohydroxyphosphoribosylaminopyrimidine deaminase / 5-amino-6-(5-phosphoribosylamino)uracil reductase